LTSPMDLINSRTPRGRGFVIKLLLCRCLDL